MSLTHWWPLIGDTQDKITGQNLNGATTYVTSGKIGQCGQITSPLLASFTLEEEFEVINHSFSMSCWIKINKETIINHLNSLSGTGQATGAILGYSNYDGVALIWYVSNKTNFDKITIRGTIRDYNNSYFFGTDYQLPYDTWTHVTMVSNINKETLTLYINGNAQEPISTHGRTGFGANGSKTQLFGIGRECYYSGGGTKATLPMLLNDVRVYDHALSQAEIKELSKALVIHYTFDDKLLLSKPELLQNETGLIQPTGVKDFSLSTNSKIGIHSGNFNGDTSYIDTPIVKPTMFTDDYTLSFWVYPLDSGRAVYFGDYQLSNGYKFNFERRADGITRYWQNGGGTGKDKNASDITAPANTWTMLTFSHSASTPKNLIVYKNGDEAKNIITVTEDPPEKVANSIMRLGRDGRTKTDSSETPFYGYIDDFRYYATQLSDEDIKDLYNCGGRISNFGDALTGEFIEDTANAKINKNHTIQINEFIENDEGKASIKKGNILSSRQIIEI